MSVEYKTWTGKLPHAVLVSGKDANNVLYYETGFEQLHPIPEIDDWMSERGYSYRDNWNVVTVEQRKEWAFVFDNQEICNLFLLRWL